MYVSNKKLTIIVPVYNAERQLLDCIESIVKELDNSMECFFIDDGSIDSSYQILLPYVGDNIHVIHQDNHGVSYTRNKGMSISSGEYIMFVDADDRLISGWSKCFYHSYEYQADIVYFSEQYRKGGSVPRKKELLDRLFGLSHPLGNLTAPWAKIYKRKLLENHNLSFHNDIMYGEDMLFNLQVILCANKIESYPKSIYLYRNNTESVSHTFNKKWFESNLLFLYTVENILTQNISKEDSDQYISFSLYNSIELYIKLLCRIPNDSNRLSHLVKLRDERLEKYMKKYPGESPHCYSRFIMSLVARHHDRIANRVLLCMRRGFNLKQKIKKNNVQEWQII